ncbi:alcohol acetyltransferase domain-containing protein [Trichoderma velutinum]
MSSFQKLKKLRSLGKLEQVSASCHHLGFFNNVGVSAHYQLPRSSSLAASDLRRLVYASAGDVISKHPVLSAIPVNEDTPNAYFVSLPSIDLNQSIKFLKRSQPLNTLNEGEDKELDAILEYQHNTNFKDDYGTAPFWRLIILQDAEGDMNFTASFIYHHAIGDGISGMVFHNTFLDSLQTVSSSLTSGFQSKEIVMPDEDVQILPALDQLHPLLIDPKPSFHSATHLNEWTGNSIRCPNKSRWTSLHISSHVSKSFFYKCKDNELSVASVVSSIIATTLFHILPLDAEALTCIIPVNLRPWLRLSSEATKTAMGSYFDATRVQFIRPGQHSEDLGLATDIWSGARQASKGIKHYLDNVSPSGEPYTAVSVLETIPDVSVIFTSIVGKPRDAAFEVTNIGLFSSVTTSEGNVSPDWRVGKVLLSRSSLVSGAAITISIATGGDESMTVGFSWQEGVVEDGLVEKVTQGVRKYFEDNC